MATATQADEPERIELLRPTRRVLEVALRLGTTEAHLAGAVAARRDA